MMNEKQIEAATGVLVAAFSELSNAQIKELITVPFLDLVAEKQLVHAA
jgi:hypothetical protein